MTDSRTGQSGNDCSREPPEEVFPVIKDFEIIRGIGKGGFGSVYLVRDVTGTVLALKVVRRGEGVDCGLYDREDNSLCSYRPLSGKHPNLLTILHIGKDEDNGFFYYTMPLADDISGAACDPNTTDTYRPKTLDNVIPGPGKAMPVRDAITAVLPVLDALEFLHKSKPSRLHRDVKPANILIIDGMPVLGDIGLLTESKPVMTQYFSGGYTPAGGVTTPAGDLYSVGRILLAAVGGDVSKPGVSLPTVQSEDTAELFAALNKVILKAEALKYKSAAAMRKDLQKLLKKNAKRKRRPNGKASQMLADLRRAASPDRARGEAQPMAGAGTAISRGLDYHNRADAEAVISRGLELARMRQTSFILAAGLCLLVVVLCQICISSLWPKTGGALFNIASPLKWLCYVAFVVFALFATPRARNARLLVVALIAFCITVYLNGKIAQHYKGRALWRSASLEDTLRWENRQCGDITIRCPTGSEIDIRSNGCYGVNHPKLPAFQILIEAHAQANLAGQTNPTESARQYVMMSIEKRGFKPVDPGFTSVSRMLTPTLQTTWHQCYSMAANGAQRLDIVVPVEDSLVLGCYTRKSSAQDESHKLAEWVTATCSGLTKK